MTFRGVVFVTHRWIGLSTSIVLSIAGGTGALFLWPGDYLLRKVAGRLHETLALGHAGAWIVLVATGGAVVLQLGGLVLWWKRRSIAVRTGAGWRLAFVDLHHSAGVLGLLLMLTLAVTAIGMALVTPESHPALRRALVDLHTARSFSMPIKLLYLLGTLGFAIQGVTGVVMWWKPKSATGKSRRRSEPDRIP